MNISANRLCEKLSVWLQVTRLFPVFNKHHSCKPLPSAVNNLARSHHISTTESRLNQIISPPLKLFDFKAAA